VVPERCGLETTVAAEPRELELTLTPRSRYDAIDVAECVAREHGDALAPYRRVAYCSHHTTAGYLEQSLCTRLEHSRDRLDPFVGAFRHLFPEGAAYRHDRLEERTELSEESRAVEPRNADSHLAFISAGLRNCVTYHNRPGEPVYFLDLDGTDGTRVRERRTTVLAYDRSEVVERTVCDVPVSGHPIDSVNLSDPRVGVMPRIEELLDRHGVAKGRVDIALHPGESDAGVTVNEFETLLMRHDLAEVLSDPLRFLARTGRNALADPGAIPQKSWGYAKYDLVQVMNELIDALRISSSSVERLLAKAMAVPARRKLRLKRSVSMLVSDRDGGAGRLVKGTYQSPILIQWGAADARRRVLDVTLTRFR
jgi:thiamine phosphate synthase YjbQ (UPF0047 family)